MYKKTCNHICKDRTNYNTYFERFCFLNTSTVTKIYDTFKRKNTTKDFSNII